MSAFLTTGCTDFALISLKRIRRGD